MIWLQDISGISNLSLEIWVCIALSSTVAEISGSNVVVLLNSYLSGQKGTIIPASLKSRSFINLLKGLRVPSEIKIPIATLLTTPLQGAWMSFLGKKKPRKLLLTNTLGSSYTGEMMEAILRDHKGVQSSQWPVGIYPKDCPQDVSYSEIVVDTCSKNHCITPCDCLFEGLEMIPKSWTFHHYSGSQAWGISELGDLIFQPAGSTGVLFITTGVTEFF